MQISKATAALAMLSTAGARFLPEGVKELAPKADQLGKKTISLLERSPVSDLVQLPAHDFVGTTYPAGQIATGYPADGYQAFGRFVTDSFVPLETNKANKDCSTVITFANGASATMPKVGCQRTVDGYLSHTPAATVTPSIEKRDLLKERGFNREVKTYKEHEINSEYPALNQELVVTQDNYYAHYPVATQDCTSTINLKGNDGLSTPLPEKDCAVSYRQKAELKEIKLPASPTPSYSPSLTQSPSPSKTSDKPISTNTNTSSASLKQKVSAGALGFVSFVTSFLLI
jgi:hypothetical protein